MSNMNGVVDLNVTKNTAAENMAIYDSLPPANRRAYREAALNLHPQAGSWSTLPGVTSILVDVLTQIQRESAVATYGTNYPVDIRPVRA